MIFSNRGTNTLHRIDIPMSHRPSSYPEPSQQLLSGVGQDRLPLLDVLTSPVPHGLFQSPVDWRHVLCLHLGDPVVVSYGSSERERPGLRIHGQFCVVPSGSSTRWILSQPAKSLLLRLRPSILEETAYASGISSGDVDLKASIHIRDRQIEQIGWMMQLEANEGHSSGRLFADSLASALAARLISLQFRVTATDGNQVRRLPALRLRRVVEYIEAHLDHDLGLAELASVAGYSLSHFKPLFRHAVGMPAHRFVMERRVQRARTNLLEGKKSVTEIAFETGFSHPSHMARRMRSILGFSPSQVARGTARPSS
jgi:AraC family transcriptional regulator